MLWKAALIAMLGLLALGGEKPASAGYVTCGFAPNIDDRRITGLHHLSCGQAKRVLRQLKGTRRTVPMVCGRHSRELQGWRLSSDSKYWAVVMTKYQRGRVSFVYERIDHPWPHAWCPPPGGSGEVIDGD